MSDYIYDGDYTQPSQHGPDVTYLPFSNQGDQSTTIYELSYVQLIDNWVPLAVNSIHPTVGTAFLVNESELKPTNVAGVMQWTRRYATVPISRDEGGSIAYQFIGLTLASTLRIPFVRAVACRVALSYYLVGPNSAYASVRNLPVIDKQRYYIGSLAGGIGTDVLALSSAASTILSTPTTETYQGWITAKFEIAAEATQFTRWQGNIWQGATKYITAI